MLDHISIYVDDFEKAKAFYSATLKPIGYVLIMEFAEWSVAGFGEGGKPDFWFSKKESSHNSHVAFAVDNKEKVDAFYAAALAAGGSDNGAPGYRKDYSPGYYGGFITDPFGNNIEAVFHDPSPAV